MWTINYTSVFSESGIFEELVRSWTFVALVILVFLIGAISNVVLIVGVLKERPKYILAYVIFNCIQLVLGFVTVSYDLVIKKAYPSESLILFLALLIAVYFTICVYSYYLEVQKRQKEKDTVVSITLPTTA
jgi:hypothetical protein